MDLVIHLLKQCTFQKQADHLYVQLKYDVLLFDFLFLFWLFILI